MGKYECESEIYMTTSLTVATVSEKMRVAFCKLFFSKTNNGKWKRSFTTCDILRRNKHAQYGLSIMSVLKHARRMHGAGVGAQCIA